MLECHVDWKHCVVTLSVAGAIAFAAVATWVPEKRLRLAIPAALLLILAVYEIHMIRWEKTVHAPIRLDLAVEVPLMFLLLAWGIAVLILPRRTRRKD
jgi:NO-binding membrane sensor protein with MHYT domain